VLKEGRRIADLSYAIDLESTVGNQLYVGFSAAGGGDSCNFDINSWQFSAQ